VDALLYVLFAIAAIAIILAMTITATGFVYALLWLVKWFMRRYNGNNNNQNNRPS
jgi:hypothetical protein